MLRHALANQVEGNTLCTYGSFAGSLEVQEMVTCEFEATLLGCWRTIVAQAKGATRARMLSNKRSARRTRRTTINTDAALEYILKGKKVFSEATQEAGRKEAEEQGTCQPPGNYL